MSAIISKTDLRSVVAIVLIGTLIGSWVYFLSIVEVDESKKLDGTMLLLMMWGLIAGTLIGVFSWLGFKQGQLQPTK